MSINYAAMCAWDIDTFVNEYERRLRVMDQLVGSLYPSIIQDELRMMEKYSSEKWHYHPNWLREKGLVATSWTDEHGIVHNPYVKCPSVLEHPGSIVINRHHDAVARDLTCLWCIGSP